MYQSIWWIFFIETMLFLTRGILLLWCRLTSRAEAEAAVVALAQQALKCRSNSADKPWTSVLEFYISKTIYLVPDTRESNLLFGYEVKIPAKKSLWSKDVLDSTPMFLYWDIDRCKKIHPDGSKAWNTVLLRVTSQFLHFVSAYKSTPLFLCQTNAQRIEGSGVVLLQFISRNKFSSTFGLVLVIDSLDGHSHVWTG